MSYDSWKTTPPDYYDDDPVLYCARCGLKDDPEAFESEACNIYEDGEREEYTETICPKCGSPHIETAAEHEERLRDV